MTRILPWAAPLQTALARGIATLAVAAVAMASMLLPTPASAVTPFIITDIRVEGLERLEAGTVFNYLPLKVGDEMNDEEARISIKELFRTGFFKDVELAQDGTALVVKVVERPSIAEFTISGNRVVKTELLEQGLEQAGLVSGRIFNSAALDRVVQEIKNSYLALGRYSASVKITVTNWQRNRVAIELDINEGRVATIRKINIIGAEAVPVATVIDQMSLRDRRGWRPFKRSNQYSKQKLEADIEAIRSYYLDRGFHDFKVVASSADISHNKQNIFISISIDEGARFVFGESVFEPARPTPVSGLAEVDDIVPGTPFSRKVVSRSKQAITARYADAGYAFVNVRPIYQTDRDANVVTTVFAIDPKQRVYVRKVEITGNTHTRDQVIRRELRQLEGAWYSAGKVSRSRDRLRRLGYFQDVEIETPDVPGTTDQVDMQVIVTERKTGYIEFSIGYSDTDGALASVTYAQRNVLGTGRELNLKISSSAAVQTTEIKYVNPYYTADGISRGITFTNRKLETDEINSAEFVVNTNAGGLSYRIPIAETNSLNLAFSAERVELEATGSTPSEIRCLLNGDFMAEGTTASRMDTATNCNDLNIDSAEAKPTGTNLLVTVGVSKDTRNDFLFPTDGARGSLSAEIAAPGSDFEYYKLNLHGVGYRPLNDLLTLKGDIAVGYGGGFGNSRALPFFRRYHAGGSNSVRGYDGRSLGPRDGGTTPASIGGDKRLLLNAEVLFPPFGAGGTTDKRFSIFVDGGQVFAQDKAFDPGKLCYSGGIVFNWFSPVGPFSISYAGPLNQSECGVRDFEEFQITLGTAFR